MKIVFMGTPDFAATVLQAVHDWTKNAPHRELVAVYCQPDRPAGRGNKVQAPVVKTLAQQLDIPVYQPLRFTPEDEKTLANLFPDVLVVAAYGLLLPQSVLDIPRIGPYNVHASLLPRYRGAAPIQRSIMNQDNATGITIMRMEKGLDTGPMLLQRALAIGLDDTAEGLSRQLADLGGRLMIEALTLFETDTQPQLIAQDDALASHAAKLAKADGQIDWQQPALAVHAHVRGVTPWPGGQTTLTCGDTLLPLRLKPGRVGKPWNDGEKPTPGTLLGLVDGCLAFACLDAPYLVEIVQPANKAAMTASSFWNGYRGAGS